MNGPYVLQQHAVDMIEDHVSKEVFEKLKDYLIPIDVFQDGNLQQPSLPEDFVVCGVTVVCGDGEVYIRDEVYPHSFFETLVGLDNIPALDFPTFCWEPEDIEKVWKEIQKRNNG
jgi:hypothetical protein